MPNLSISRPTSMGRFFFAQHIGRVPRLAQLSGACPSLSAVEQGDAQTRLICEIEENEAKSTPAEVELWHRAEPWSTGRPCFSRA